MRQRADRRFAVMLPLSRSPSLLTSGFARRHDLKRHELLHTGVKKYMCEACETPFVRLDALQRHHKSEVREVAEPCVRAVSFMFTRRERC